MTVDLVNPRTGKILSRNEDWLVDEDGNRFPIIKGVPRICEQDNYAGSFGIQWNLFQRTQLDPGRDQPGPTEQRFFAETAWSPTALADLDVLEVGSGAGRFSRVVLSRTNANLYSIDYSSAVEANQANNAVIAPDRFYLFQASIYEMPFRDNSFDKIFCLGVLQHTPNFEQSIQSLVRKAKPGGEIVVDFYCLRGFWTKLSTKYFLRPVTRRMPQEELLRIIESNIDWLIRAHQAMTSRGLGVLTRFLPIVDLRTFPKDLPVSKLREWAVLDTFDVYSPEFDNPQRIKTVADMFRRNGARVTFADTVATGHGLAAVVRAVKIG